MTRIIVSLTSDVGVCVTGIPAGVTVEFRDYTIDGDLEDEEVAEALGLHSMPGSVSDGEWQGLIVRDEDGDLYERIIFTEGHSQGRKRE